jgi:adenylate kinase family enzyme
MHPALGPRICIIGPSSCGKSVLADRLGKAYGLPIIHLDTYHHQPHGNWIPRPPAEYLALHDAAIATDNWVMDGNYTKSMPQRFARATTIIKIDMNRFGAFYRFIKRYFKGRADPSYLTGAPKNIEEKFNWNMVWWILQPKSLSKGRSAQKKSREALFEQHAHKIITIRSFKEMDQLFVSLPPNQTPQ